MKNIIAITLAAGLMAAAVSAEVRTSFDLASAYVFRGVTYNDGAVFQPGIEVSGLGLPEEMGSVAVGAWANYDIDDYGGSLTGSQFSEVDWYAFYSLPSMVDGLDVSIGYFEYTYPMSGDASTPPTVADKELRVGLGYAVGDVGLGVTYYQFVGGDYCGDARIELSAGYDYAISDSVSASFGAVAGYVEPENGDSGLADGSLSAGVSYALTDIWSLGVNGSYIAQLDDEILPDGPGSYDVNFVGVMSLSASF
ncbi:MAG: hypothetical protein GXY61_07265 [Lentisphaerae bacterium]|jgi:hypothetical protein|nr:hypothetical protein [Lentisphaerota bacterium]